MRFGKVRRFSRTGAIHGEVGPTTGYILITKRRDIPPILYSTEVKPSYLRFYESEGVYQ
jgi:hypothetical protein